MKGDFSITVLLKLTIYVHCLVILALHFRLKVSSLPGIDTAWPWPYGSNPLPLIYLDVTLAPAFLRKAVSVTCLSLTHRHNIRLWFNLLAGIPIQMTMASRFKMYFYKRTSHYFKVTSTYSLVTSN